MNLELEKNWLLKKIAAINNEGLILKLKAIINEDAGDTDFWDELPDDLKNEVEVAIAEIEEGRFSSHNEVMKQYEKWLKK